jgi:hypothetical protein
LVVAAIRPWHVLLLLVCIVAVASIVTAMIVLAVNRNRR